MNCNDTVFNKVNQTNDDSIKGKRGNCVHHYYFICFLMSGKTFYGYSRREWVRCIVGYVVFLFFGGIEASQGVYYALLKEAFDLSYTVQGILVSMASYSFIIGSPFIGYLMTLIGAKSIVVSGFIAYIVAYACLYFVTKSGFLFPTLFIEGLGGVLLDVSMNTLSTVIFKTHRGVMMNYLHFFYGLGSALGPKYATLAMSWFGIGFRGIFIALLIPAILGVIITLFSDFSLHDDKKVEVNSEVQKKKNLSVIVPQDNQLSEKEDIKKETNDDVQEVKVDISVSSKDVVVVETKKEMTIWRAFLTPVVWLLGINMGAVYAIESVTVNWSGLYFQEMFGMSPKVEGATFLSLFFAYYTIARLGTGFVVDLIGDVNCMLLFNVLLILLYIIAFSLGKIGFGLLAFSGFLISPFYPTSITVPMEILGDDATNTISVILCIACCVNPLMQIVVGLINDGLGPQWGYRISSVMMCCLMIICMIIVKFVVKKRNKK